ncbi:MAG TPA: hypothetical protein VGK37_11990 [Casimicrobiaceae bacterium]|jgi:hypothetical protein
MKRGLITLAIAVAAGAPPAVLACGACVEDRVAAAYDHAVIDAAIVRHQQVVFVAIEGPVDAGRIGARIVAAASRLQGIRAGTVRTSISPAAFSFALDSTQSPHAAMAAFRKVVGDPAARLTVVRIMRDGILHEPR